MSTPNPSGTTSDDAGTAATALSIAPQALAELDSACAELAAALAEAQDRAAALGTLTTWGLGENDPALHTARELVRIFREKASGGPGDAHTALAEYRSAIDGLRTLFGRVATTLPQVDEVTAQQLGQLDG